MQVDAMCYVHPIWTLIASGLTGGKRPLTPASDESEANMSDKPKSPRIDHVSWGRMEVQGLGRGRDFKLFPGGGRAWDWTETNTHHVPGIQPTDVQELLDHGSEVIVLSRGMQLVLHTCPETFDLLRVRGIPTHVEETTVAVDLYNALAETKAVGGLFHSTC